MTSFEASTPAVLPYAEPPAMRPPAAAGAGAARRRASLWRRRTDRWTAAHGRAAAIMGALGVAACWEPWREIFMLASKEPEYSHIFLVPLVALWMVFVRRARIRHCRPTGTGIGLLVA